VVRSEAASTAAEAAAALAAAAPATAGNERRHAPFYASFLEFFLCAFVFCIASTFLIFLKEYCCHFCRFIENVVIHISCIVKSIVK
jgi:hypothetical protein